MRYDLIHIIMHYLVFLAIHFGHPFYRGLIFAIISFVILLACFVENKKPIRENPIWVIGSALLLGYNIFLMCTFHMPNEMQLSPQNYSYFVHLGISILAFLRLCNLFVFNPSSHKARIGFNVVAIVYCVSWLVTNSFN